MVNKRDELLKFVEQHRVDALLVSETWLTRAKEVMLPNYNVFRADREDSKFGGGVAIHSKYIIDQMPTPTSAFQRLEATSIVVNLAKGLIKIVSAYHSLSDLVC